MPMKTEIASDRHPFICLRWIASCCARGTHAPHRHQHRIFITVAQHQTRTWGKRYKSSLRGRNNLSNLFLQNVRGSTRNGTRPPERQNFDQKPETQGLPATTGRLSPNQAKKLNRASHYGCVAASIRVISRPRVTAWQQTERPLPHGRLSRKITK